MNKVDLSKLTTETRNPKTMTLDDMSIHEFLTVMNEEDQQVPLKVKEAIPQIEKAIKVCIEAIKNGGKLYYIGSGTSGRLGGLDTAECPPTFGTVDEIQAIMAGGENAFIKAKEGAEDNEQAGYDEIYQHHITSKDVVLGIAASGRTPHTIGALKAANEIGATTISLICNPNSKMSCIVTIPIEIKVGPEVITGSTRLKAGTAQKLVLNMISTGTMVGLGKTYQNLMVNMKPSNEKLVERSRRIIMDATGCDYDTATVTLEKAHHTKVAIIMILLGCDEITAKEKLSDHDGFVKRVLEDS